MGINRTRRSIDTKTESKDSNARKLEKLNQSIYDYAIKQEAATESVNGKNRQFRHKPFCCDMERNYEEKIWKTNTRKTI